jgi:DNA-3-methyladenine glycosylase
MFGPPGCVMDYCCNVVVGEKGYGAAVLIRALEPISGLEFMRQRRKGRPDIELTNGPAKLCQALQITKPDNGQDLSKGQITPTLSPPIPKEDVAQAKEVPWRVISKPV